MPFWQKIAMSIQKIDFFVPNTNIFGSKLHFFVPRSLTGQCFQHERGVSLVPWYGFQKFYSKTAQCGPKLAFLAKCWPFCLIWSHVNQKTMQTRCLTFASSKKNYDFWPQNCQIWPNICIFGHFGPNLGIFGPFGPMPDQKIMRIRWQGGFLISGYQNLCSLPKWFGWMAQKWRNFVQNWHFSSNIGIFSLFGALLVAGPTP